MASCYYNINWGTVPDWFAGIGTIASVLLVGLALVHEMRRRRLDDERSADERHDLEISVARLVTADTTWKHDVSTGWIGTVVVTNDSPGPILSLDIQLVAVDAFAKKHPRTEWKPGGPGLRKWVARIPAGGVYEVPLVPSHVVAGPDEQYPGYVEGVVSQVMVPTLQFTDYNGLRWKRFGNRQPTRLVRHPDHQNV